MSDLLLLQLIFLGWIRTDESGNVYAGRSLRPRRTWRKAESRRRYVKLKWSRLSRTIAVAKLIWMIANRRSVPDGMHVDHLNEDSTDDRPSNLRLLPARTNERNGVKKRWIERDHPDFQRMSTGFSPETWIWPIPF